MANNEWIGKLTALISALNMCKSGQTSGCYSTPNRIGVTLGVTNNQNMAFDFNVISSLFTLDHLINQMNEWML
jgi:hypothetical protein